jgi:hypothetical protein
MAEKRKQPSVEEEYAGLEHSGTAEEMLKAINDQGLISTGGDTFQRGYIKDADVIVGWKELHGSKDEEQKTTHIGLLISARPEVNFVSIQGTLGNGLIGNFASETISDIKWTIEKWPDEDSLPN